MTRLEQAVAEALAGRSDVAVVYLFGSLARGELAVEELVAE